MVKYPKKFAPKGTNFVENSNLAWVGNFFGEGGGVCCNTGAILLPLSLCESYQKRQKQMLFYEEAFNLQLGGHENFQVTKN